VETAYSTLKRTFNESVMEKTMVNAAGELAAKISIYNMLARICTKEEGKKRREGI
jgi:hypothetical protein